MSRFRSLSWALLPLVVAVPALAQPVDDEAPPYDPWDGQYYPPPGAPPPGVAPPPEVGRPERDRRPVELVPGVGLFFPACREGSASDARCAGVRPGLHAGFTALWRVHPHVAWGGTLELAGFRYDPPESLGLRDPEAGAVFLGVVGRAYVLEQGIFDPYFQLGIGLAAIGRSYLEEDERIEETGAGPAVRFGGGLDFFLSRRLKLGPAISYTQVLVDKIRRCNRTSDEACTDFDEEAEGHVAGFAMVSAQLTILLGNPL